TALPTLGLLDVMHDYASGASGVTPCQRGASDAWRQNLVHCPGRHRRKVGTAGLRRGSIQTFF
ncbi:MAG: hypothetical protein ACE5JX_19495, partial [Acidobacteriota bacterium]